MPFLIESVLLGNELFGPSDQNPEHDGGFNAEQLLGLIAEASTIREAAEALGLLATLSEEKAANMVDFLNSIPASLDAALLAGARSALDRNLRVQLSWEPAYDFQLRAWEVSVGDAGLCNLHLMSPHPYEGPAD